MDDERLPWKSNDEAPAGEAAGFDMRRVVLGMLGLFLIVYCGIGMRNFAIRMARCHQDDCPILYAQAYADPTLFAGDYQIGSRLEDRVPFCVLATAANWVPALLWKHAGIDPYAVTWLIALAQGAGIGIGIYVLARAIGAAPLAGWIAVLFGYVAVPWGWNPAIYATGPDWHFFPYAAYVAIGPILFAFACLVREKPAATLSLLFVGGLIHPNVALYAVTITGCYWLFGLRRETWRSTALRLAALTGTAVLIALPALIAQRMMPSETVSHAEFIAGAQHNQHLWPWSHDVRWGMSWKTILRWSLLTFLALRYREKFRMGTVSLWTASLWAFLLLGATQYLGRWTEMPTLLMLTGLRSYMWTALISLPLVAHYWYEHLRSGRLIGAVLSLLCIALPLFSIEYPLFWPLIAGLALLDVSDGRLGLWTLPDARRRDSLCRAGALLLLAGWSVTFFEWPLPNWPSATLRKAWLAFAWDVRGVPPRFSERVLLLGSVGLFAIGCWAARRYAEHGARIRIRRGVQQAAIAIAVVAPAVYFVNDAWHESEAQRDSVGAGLLDAQLWAREHTPRSSIFVVPSEGGWRTLSLRHQFEAFTRESYAYQADLATKRHRDRLLRFYGFSEEEGRRDRGGRLYIAQRERFRQFDADDYRRFANEFGATHIVLQRSARTDALDLPVGYRNERYSVFELSPLEISERPKRRKSSTTERG